MIFQVKARLKCDGCGVYVDGIVPFELGGPQAKTLSIKTPYAEDRGIAFNHTPSTGDDGDPLLCSVWRTYTGGHLSM